MTKKLDRDVKVLRACVRALDQSSNPRTLNVNMQFLFDQYRNPNVRKKLAAEMGARKAAEINEGNK